MPAPPRLVLVDPARVRRAALRQRALSLVVGAALVGASAAPFLLALGR